MKEVYVIFQDRELSCDSDYGSDGFMIIWDSEEIIRNCTTSQMIDKVKEYCDDTYDNIVNHLKDEFNINYLQEKSNVDTNYWDEVYEFLCETTGCFQRFEYQTISSMMEIWDTEEQAKEQVEYYTNNHSYKSKYRYIRYVLKGYGENKPIELSKDVKE